MESDVQAEAPHWAAAATMEGGLADHTPPGTRDEIKCMKRSKTRRWNPLASLWLHCPSSCAAGLAGAVNKTRQGVTSSRPVHLKDGTRFRILVRIWTPVSLRPDTGTLDSISCCFSPPPVLLFTAALLFVCSGRLWHVTTGAKGSRPAMNLAPSIFQCPACCSACEGPTCPHHHTHAAESSQSSKDILEKVTEEMPLS